MADNKTLSQLIAATGLTDADLALIRQGTDDKSMTMQLLYDYIIGKDPLAQSLLDTAQNTSDIADLQSLHTTSSITDTGNNSQASPVLNQWYQPAASFNLTLTEGTYLILVTMGIENFVASGGDCVLSVQLGKSATPGSSLISIPVGSAYAGTNNAGSVIGYDTACISDVISITGTETIYVNIRAASVSGISVLTSISIRNDIFAEGLIKAVKIGD
jgi:hypothetical protein